MKKSYLLLLAGIFPICLAAQTLQSVTYAGNTTNQWIQITGSNGLLSTGAGLELFGNASTVTGYIKAMNRATGVPGTLKLQDSGGDTHINPGGGRVGIGTAIPTTTLDINGTFRVSNGLQTIKLVTDSSSSGYELSVGLNDNGVNFYNNSKLRGFNISNFNGRLMTILPNGNTGIGTSSPMNSTNGAGLHISRGDHSTIMLGEPFAGYGGFIQTTDNRHRVFIGANLYDDPVSSWRNPQGGKGAAGISVVADASNNGGQIDFYTSSDGGIGRSMCILSNGNVGINTTDTKGYKLAVNGSAIFTQVKVKTFNTWPDFVFHNDYVLPSLPELESYIKTNQHLPDIPSAAEVEKEGIDLGEMNRKMLQKIEEVTLYLIELKKENEILKRENQQVVERMKLLEEMIKK